MARIYFQGRGCLNSTAKLVRWLYEGFIIMCNVIYIYIKYRTKQQKQTNRKKSNKIRDLWLTTDARPYISKREAGLHIPITFITADK